MVNLNENQLKKIRQYIEYFKAYSKTDAYKEDMKDREKREAFYASISKEKFQSFNDFEFGEMISYLWAARVWQNKDYHVNKIISENGLEKIKNELTNLLFDTANIKKNFERSLKNIKYLGPASITELLCYFHPRLFGIWNNKARQALNKLGFEEDLPLNKYEITGNEYQRFNDTIASIAEELKKSGFKDADHLFVDYFLYEVTLREIEKEPIPPVKESFDHDEVRDYIRDIGIWLGFVSETEKHIGPGARIDVIWKAQIGNLGVVNYVFEVHKSGSIDSLIVNLQKAKHNPTVQKVIAVSDAAQLEKIKNETKGLPDDFIRSLVFWEVDDVIGTYDKLQEVNNSINRLGLVKSEFGA